MSATLKYALVSHIKMELMAKMVRGKKVQDALDTLQFLPKKSAKDLYKVIKSAANNAVKNLDKDVNTLYVQTIDVWNAPKLKRIRFTSRSRISHYAKYRSFVRVVLNSK
jgi:large subunit ribosomal protein L22